MKEVPSAAEVRAPSERDFEELRVLIDAYLNKGWTEGTARPVSWVLAWAPMQDRTATGGTYFTQDMKALSVVENSTSSFLANAAAATSAGDVGVILKGMTKQ